ncbi:TetR/AcrR family transcriptional regulator [Nocardioides ferulae]|uniref:TetR/AcrR family transcriptional regulator n=1 Tax=Nocardioides ferulae TaxID=2340821 RepID=UPI000EB320F2|nr:TetR/AcrR family transcriptional regulator [Nocardioides ferulae]
MPAPARRRPRQARSVQMKQRILDAAAQVLAEQGYAAMTTNRVAARAEVSVGSLYRYFEDRHDLMEHLREASSAATMAELTAAMVEAVALPPRAGVRLVVGTLVDSLERHGPVVRALIDEVPMGSHQNALPQLEGQLQQLARVFVARQVPDLPAAEVDARVYLALGVTLNACLRIALERPPDLDRDGLVELLTDLLVLGLGMPPRGAPAAVPGREG